MYLQGCGAVWPSVSSVLCQGAQGLGTDRQRLRITADSSSNDLPWQRAHGAIVVHGLSAVPITHQRENQSTCHGNQGIIDIGGRTAASSLVDAHVTIKVSDLLCRGHSPGRRKYITLWQTSTYTGHRWAVFALR